MDMKNGSFRREDGWMTAKEAGINLPQTMVYEGSENIHDVRMSVDWFYRMEQEAKMGIPWYARGSLRGTAIGGIAGCISECVNDVADFFGGK